MLIITLTMEVKLSGYCASFLVGEQVSVAIFDISNNGLDVKEAWRWLGGDGQTC